MAIAAGGKPREAIRRRSAWLYRDWQLYVLVLLPLLYFLVFKYGPMFGIIIAFKDYNIFQGIWASPGSGLRRFGKSLRWTRSTTRFATRSS
ncbi:hypothetical protein PACILC2_39500 [Paenibacillus cisolokensis]|uniref:Sugar ABC transporter permease n=1 Tax=Paenibacillus cisolokensis TaxID=1658519 RepID=A0ABQ4NB21_9BACL|nr:hypothetical protein PACILC2_39500 [Paenibacillus cisolokensis]